MRAAEHRGATAPSPDFSRSWRYRTGLALIAMGHGILLLGMLLPLFGASAGVAGAAMLGGELLSLASIVVLGTEGFKAIKSGIFAFVKAGFDAPVGRLRHYVGIALLCTNGLTTYTLAAYAWLAFERSTPESPFPVIWGLDFAQQGSLVFWLLLTGELSFLVAIYGLRAEGWGRFRSLLAWPGGSAA